MSIHLCQLGEIFQEEAIMDQERTPSWAVAVGLMLYPQSASFRITLTQAQLSISITQRASTN